MASTQNSNHNQDQGEEIDDTKQGSDQVEARAGKPQSFSELARIARESKSSWSEAVPGRKADNQVMLAIVIAIILISGITLISGYQEQLSVKLDAFKTEFPDKNETPVLSESGLNSATNALLVTITQLETQVAELQAKIIELNTTVAELESLAQTAPAISTGSVTHHQESVPETPVPLHEPEPKSAIEAPTIAEPAAKTPAPVKAIIQIQKETRMPVNGAPVSVSPTNTALLDESPWFINIGAFSDPTSAAKLLKKVQGVVENAQIQDIQVKNQTLYRIRAFGYISQDEARRDAERLHSTLGLSGTWISKDK